jgi:hypothetical protein
MHIGHSVQVDDLGSIKPFSIPFASQIQVTYGSVAYLFEVPYLETRRVLGAVAHGYFPNVFGHLSYRTYTISCILSQPSGSLL